MRTTRLTRSLICLSAPFAILGLCLACGGGEPTSPQTPLIPAGTAQGALASADGAGRGGVSVTTKPIPEGYFDANIAVHIVDARPNTTYIVQRAPEVGRALGNDGICQRGLGLAPWSAADAPAPNFVSFVLPGAASPITLTTSATGEGSVAFELKIPTTPTGTRFDVMFRLLNDLSAPSSVFYSTCFTVTVL